MSIDVEHTGAARDPYGNLRVGFEGTTTLQRSDYGVTFNAALETGGVLVSREDRPRVRDLRDQGRLTGGRLPLTPGTKAAFPLDPRDQGCLCS